MESLPVWQLGALVLLLLAAALWDIRFRKIPNVLNAATAAAGVTLQVVNAGVVAALSGVAAGVLTIALLWHPWMKGRLGGGDVKLAGAAATSVGLGGLPIYLLAGAMAGGAIAVVCYLGSSKQARGEIKSNLTVAVLTGTVPEAPLKGEGRMSVPYGVAASAGALITLWMR